MKLLNTGLQYSWKAAVPVALPWVDQGLHTWLKVHLPWMTYAVLDEAFEAAVLAEAVAWAFRACLECPCLEEHTVTLMGAAGVQIQLACHPASLADVLETAEAVESVAAVVVLGGHS